MTKRSPVSSLQNIWFNAEQVDNVDLSIEQTFNSTITSGIINNHLGSGILPEHLLPIVLFDSSTVSGFLDGLPLTPSLQPSDSEFGNQLTLSLDHSMVTSVRTVKAVVFGLDFQSNLIYETFVFQQNESQTGKKHFAFILSIMINDMKGVSASSFNLGGHLFVKEANAGSLSRDTIMSSQNQQPNLFFRDFVPGASYTLETLLKAAMPSYDITTLNIYTQPNDNKAILVNDVSTQLGQKFIATTNNIQKVTLLVSVRNTASGHETEFDWTGDMVVSIYPLQSTLNCSTDLAPELAIDYSPSPTPIAQISFNYASLTAQGIVLDSVPQPVEFVFSNSGIASGNLLKVGSYYAVTVKRSGSANKCDLLFASGIDLIPDSRMTMFTGELWVDLPQEDLWYIISTDAAKVSDALAYDEGKGVSIPKTKTVSGTFDYSLDSLSFAGSLVSTAVFSASTSVSGIVSDQRTGQPVASRKMYEANVNLLSPLELSQLQTSADPLVLGSIVDKNKKFYDSASSQLTTKLHAATFVNDEIIFPLIEDPTDPRYDASVLALSTYLLNGDLTSAKIVPNNNTNSIYYKISHAWLETAMVGDVNGDGIVDQDDVTALLSLQGFNFASGLPLTTSITTGGGNTSFSNGYTTLTKPFVNQSGLTFQLVNSVTGIVATATDGTLVANPTNPSLAQFASSTLNFTTYPSILNYKLVIIVPGTIADHGGFRITALDATTHVITIEKIYLDGETIMSLLRADVDKDDHISSNDQFLLQKFVDRAVLVSVPAAPFPAPTSNAYNNIGSTFSVLRMKLAKFADRLDDYTASPNTRNATVHPPQDVFTSDGYYASHNFLTSPSYVVMEKRLTWQEYLLSVVGSPKLVPVVYSNPAQAKVSCFIDKQVTEFPVPVSFAQEANDLFFPNDLLVGGGLKQVNGQDYKVDFEVGTIVLNVPSSEESQERSIPLFTAFVAEENDGVTNAKFRAMKFADCSFVKSDALLLQQVRFSVSVQSYSPNLDGLDDDGYAGVIVDGKIGVSIDYETGILKLNFTNLYSDPALKTLNTKLQVHVFLKKAGFNNGVLEITATQLDNLLVLN